ncbi:ATP-binding protein [archaeon]|nr:MAG: ATP-binding protein [archaeon]
MSIKASSVLDKFMGESEKLAQAIFKLGRKLAPSVIFIDEIETLLQKRRGDTHHAVSSLQGMFLSEWDGLTQQQKQAGSVVAQGPVVVLGATNRPSDLDAAFLRRMPVKLGISLPDTAARVAIFQAQLRHESVSDDVDLVYLAEQLEGSTGADIKEVIRLAGLRRTKEISAQAQQMLAQKSSELTSLSTLNRPLKKEDFEFALNKTLHSGSTLLSYSQQQQMIDMSMEEKFIRMMAR